MVEKFNNSYLSEMFLKGICPTISVSGCIDGSVLCPEYLANSIYGQMCRDLIKKTPKLKTKFSEDYENNLILQKRRNESHVSLDDYDLIYSPRTPSTRKKTKDTSTGRPSTVKDTSNTTGGGDSLKLNTVLFSLISLSCLFYFFLKYYKYE